MNWELYVSRRKLDAKVWAESRNITTREAFLKVIGELGIEPPDDEYLSGLFPQVSTETINESAAVTTEGIDQAATRSVAPEGDGVDLRPNGKRASKVRGE